MRPNRSIVLTGTAGLALLLAAGAVDAQDTGLGQGIASDQIDQLAFAPEQSTPAPEQARDTEMGLTVDLEALADMRGGADIVENDVLLDGRVEDNTANRVVTGNNTLGGGSFANSNGLNTVIQNTGANVLIQNGMIVNVQFADPTP